MKLHLDMPKELISKDERNVPLSYRLSNMRL
jgi:hypothetical protein